MKKLFSFIFALALTLPMFAEDPISVADALDRLAAGNTGACDVKGKVKSINTNNVETYGNISYWLTDINDPEKEIQAFRFKGKDDTGYKTAADVEFIVGEEILVHANKLEMYQGKPEMNTGYYIETLKAISIDEISVSEALTRLAEKKTDPCKVKGKVLRILTKDADVAQYHNISYWLGDLNNPNDSIQAYRMYGKDGKAYATAAEVEFVVGDEILVYGNELKMYTDKNIPEINGGYYIETLKGKPVEELDWANAQCYVYLADDHWDMNLQKGDDEENDVVKLSFPIGEKEAAIADSYFIKNNARLILDHTELAANSGSFSIVFKSINSDNQNVYALELKVITDAKVYVFSKEIPIIAIDENDEEIILVGDRPYEVTEDLQKCTSEEARSYTMFYLNGDSQEKSEFRLVVSGYVTKLVTGNQGPSFWMADDANGGEVIEVFKYKSVIPANKEIQKGDKVIVTGKAENYKGTPEIINAKVQIIEGGKDIVVPEDKQVDVAGALVVAKALEQGKSTEDLYAVTGFIAAIESPYDAEKGYLTFWMSDKAEDENPEFEAYRVYCDEETAAKLTPTAKVTVTARLSHFYQAASGDKEAKEVYETVEGGAVVVIATGVEEVYTTVPASKFIYEGQLYIIRGNALYNVQGQLVK